MSNDYGAEFTNDFGVVTISSNTVTLSMQQRGSFTGSNDLSRQYPDNRHGVRVTVAYPRPVTSQIAPVVMLIPRGYINGHWHAFEPTGGPGYWTGFNISFMEHYPGELVSYYYTYDSPISLTSWDWAVASAEEVPYSSDTYGMRVWGPTGKLVFDSGTPVVRLLGQVSNWARASNYPQWRSYTSPWPYPIGTNYGFIVSNLPMQGVRTSYSPFVSPRFGFTAAGMSRGEIMCTVGGSDANSESSIYTLQSSGLRDDVLNNWLAVNPIQLFAVRLS